MNHVGQLLTKHRNLFLVLLLSATLLVSALTNHQGQTAAIVNIPVEAVSAPVLSPLESYRLQRDQALQADIAALEKLIAHDTLDEPTRNDAAERLNAIIGARQAQTAMEGALSNSSLAPCVAVAAGDALTIVTGKTDITDQDTALVMTLAAAHLGTKPQNVRIITAE